MKRVRGGRRIIGWVLGFLVLGTLADLCLLGRDARAYWFSRLPPGLLASLSRGLPRDPAVHFALGQQARRAENYQAAAQSFRRAADLDPAFRTAAAEYAQCLIDLNQPGEAYTIARNCLLHDPQLVPALLAIGRLCAQRGDWNAALRTADRVLLQHPNEPAAWLLKARAALATSDWPAARRASDRLTASRPGWWRGWVVHSSAALGQGDTRAAVAAAERSVQLAPHQAEAWRALGLALLAVGSKEVLPRTEAALRQAAALAPTDAEIRVALGDVLARRHRWAAAISELKEALRREPETNRARSLLREIYQALGEPARARYWHREHSRWEDFLQRKQMLLAQLARSEYEFRPHFELARMYARLGLWDRARAHLAQGLRFGPHPEGLALQRKFEQRGTER